MTRNHKKFKELAEKNHSLLVSQLSRTNSILSKLLTTDLTEQQQEIIISEMECIQIVLKDYKTDKECKHGHILYLSESENHDYKCYECDENFYKFEVCS